MTVSQPLIHRETEEVQILTHPEHGKELAEIFQEDNGKYSTIRAMSFIALIAAIVFGAMTMLNKDSEGRYITTTFLVAAFAPKAVQKFAERV